MIAYKLIFLHILLTCKQNLILLKFKKKSKRLEHLPYKHKNQGLSPRIQVKRLDMVVYVYNLISEARTIIPGACWPMRDPAPQKNNVDSS